MKRDSELATRVRRGYLNLAAFIAIVGIGLLPIFLYPGVRGIKIALIACAVIGIMVAVWQRSTRKWSWLFAGAVSVWSAAQLGIAILLATTAIGQAAVESLVVLSFAVLFLGLPRIVEYERLGRK